MSHELRSQIKEIGRHGQRIDFHIDMTRRVHAGTWPVEPRVPSHARLLVDRVG
ncbi:hypothetical protein F01_200001 [Burkholderia cenocepacia]|nr:hypothetical protein F01_200001 [Burkholderia cenocepacia]